ncbi:putative glycosyltransferase [Streptomyces lincolnensis]|uniref:Putative glycosyltransferase n=1 Tax=Streptomyces lincolnensis TaxID=1915 RepID=A0A1B1MGC8_STRLN|nr:nucleotide disphospho-sugar-binding domain-containing protein [Streptomyces lincolnensis]ANS67676.1 putative glycosyltransferase [Streptomyces lincolnensis]AXG54991.1 putative glycosyltransferase [Streptomyces lincolnensis]QMV09341.1 DUF1205 domain-containing protein [Streptomyces lincolnensis]
MKILFTMSPTPARLPPLVPLAWALQAHGHEVRVTGSPALTAATAAAGLTLAPVGLPEDWTRPGWWKDPELAEVHRHSMLLWEPDLVVRDGPTWLHDSCVEGFAVPYVVHIGDRFSPRLEKVADDAAAWVDTRPPALRGSARPDAWTVRRVPAPGAATVPDWLLAPSPRPRVCLLWQPRTRASAGRVATIVEAVTGLELELLVRTGVRQLLPAAGPPGRRLIQADDGLPLSLLLSGCVLLIHQGVMADAADAAVMGVPQLVLSELRGHARVGERVAETGAGRHVGGPLGKDEALRLRLLIAELVFGGHALAAARDWAGELATLPPPAAVVAHLEELTQGA